ncbi:hypothetical protein EC973_000294 [Apophysomyces ossiformis]|uniref:Zinc finger protein 830 n=1 Tax=Apophysomyces ossiformis TaxID=679940 RepID=A0A8H7BRX0_9FUNG|nr:hypothetical protein EC973_000294 [Apophysomyces ossiformis]
MPPKPEIRRLFKQQRQERQKIQKINHPFAKYDGQGRLICAVCNALVKNESVWPSHLASSVHKENIAKLKALKEKQARLQQQQGDLKRPMETDEAHNREDRIAKRPRQDEDHDEETTEDRDIEMQDTTDALPSDFFDKYHSTGDAVEKEEQEQEQEQEQEEEQEQEQEDDTEANQIPAGFFDNPEEEAKVLNKPTPSEVKQADLERDYEIFKEIMTETTEISEKAEEENEESIAIDRDEALFQQQAELDARVEALKKLRQSGGIRRREEEMQTGMEFDDTEQEIRSSLKNTVRNLLKSNPAKRLQTVFDDMDEDEEEESEEEEEEDWRAQQL